VSSEANSQNTTIPTDPIELWKRWNETTSKVWLNAIQSSTEATTKSSSLYSSWLQTIGGSANKAQEQIHLNPFQMMSSKDAWKTWFDTTMDIWRKAIQTGNDPLGLTRQWLTMMEEAQQKLLAGAPLQTDPFTLFKEWYDATSDQWSKVVEETLSSKQYLESTRPLIESYASITSAFRHANEEYFKHLQLPTITDIANVAQLVINLEEKVDTIGDSLENFEQSHQATLEGLAHLEQRFNQVATVDMISALERRFHQVATTEAVASLQQQVHQVATVDMISALERRFNQVATVDMVSALEQRFHQVATTEAVASLQQQVHQVATVDMVSALEQHLNQVDSKLDRVLAALEKLEEKEPAEHTQTSNAPSRKAQKKNASQQEVQE